MKYIKAVLLLMVLVATGFHSIHRKVMGQAIKVSPDQPTVMFAIAPIFIPWKFNDVGVGKAVVEVNINAEGMVLKAKSIEGSSDFPWRDGAFIDAAKLWRFSSSPNVDEQRALRITFIQRIVSKGASWQELAPRYTAPFQMETRHEVFESKGVPHPAILPDRKGD